MSYGTPGSPNPYASSTAPSIKPAGPVRPQPKSGWPGIAAITCGVLSGLMEVGCTVIATMAVMDAAGGEPDPESPALMLAGCGIFVGIFIAVIGIVFGIIGIAIPNSNKITAGIGAGLCAMVIICICGLMAIGMTVG